MKRFRFRVMPVQAYVLKITAENQDEAVKLFENHKWKLNYKGKEMDLISMELDR
jgi:hypothetical protein